MRNASSAFKQAIADGRVDYTLRAVVTLIDETVITLTNDDIWENGLVIDDAVSGDGDFQLGSAIINQCTISINNIYDDYSAYDFFGANVIVYVGFADLEGDTTEELLMGHYTVSDTAYNGSLITLTCLDNMMKFDKAYDSTLAYPATLGDIVLDACTHCGVTLDNSYLHFANYDYEVAVRPSGESTTYRQVISWAAQIAGCFARINSNGNLEIKFFDTVTLASYTSEVLESGTFDEDANVHYINDDFGSNLATDDVVITGVKVVLEVNSDTISQYASAYDETSTYAIGAKVTYENQLYECISAISTPEEWTADHWKDVSQMEYTAGTTGYVISVEGNPLVTGGSSAQALATYLGGLLIGMRFRTGSVTHPSDPTIEAGDLFVYTNRKMQSYAMLVSSTNFASGSNQTTQSSAATPQRNSAQRFSESTQTYVQLRKQIYAQKSYLEQQLAASGGLYYTEVPQPGGGSIVYYHDKPKLEDSQIQMVFSQTGFSLTNDGGTTWYGMTVDGTMIANILQATGINAEWINVGTDLAGWTISSDRLYARTTYPDADGEGTNAYVMMRSPSSMSGTSTSRFLVQSQSTIWASSATTISMRFTYDWYVSSLQPPNKPLTVSVMDSTETTPQTFRYSLWWREYGSSDTHTETSAGTTSLETTVGDASLPSGARIQAGITIYIDIPAGLGAQTYFLNILLQYSPSSPTSNTPPVELKATRCYLWYASDIPTDRIPTDAAFVATNNSNAPRWYVTSGGNILANYLQMQGIFASSADQVYWYASPVLNPSGGLAVYYVTQTPLTPDAPDNTDGGNVLVVGGPSRYMQMAFLADTDGSGEISIYTRHVRGANVSDWVRLTRPQRLHNYFSSRPASANALSDTRDNALKFFQATSAMTTGKPPIGDGFILHMGWDTSSMWDTQVAFRSAYSGINAAHAMAIRAGDGNNSVWGDWKTLMDLLYPVGSIYITNTNTNPSDTSLLGGGTWTLIKRVMTNKSVSDAVTWNTTNTVSGSTQSQFWIRDTRITFRMRFTNKVALADTTVTLGQIDISKLGITGFYFGTYIAANDTANSVVLININSSSPYTIQSIDSIGATAAASTSTSPTMTVEGELMFDTSSIADSACNEFHWKRTA